MSQPTPAKSTAKPETIENTPLATSPASSDSSTSSTSPTPEQQKEQFELRLKFYDRILATMTTLSVVCGSLWGLYTYLERRAAEAEKERKQQVAILKEQREIQEKEHEIRREQLDAQKREINLQLFRERKEVYLALLEACCDITVAANQQEVQQRAPAFLKLYHGKAHAVLDPEKADHDDLVKAKMDFRTRLMDYLDEKEPKSPEVYFDAVCAAVMKACRRHIDPRKADSEIEKL